MPKEKKITIQQAIAAIESFSTSEQIQIKSAIQTILDDKEKAAQQELSLLKNGGK